MRYNQIQIEGEAGNFATLTRKRGSEYIEVEIIKPTGTRKHMVQADDDGDIHSMADCLQHELDGYRGTNSERYDYRLVIERLSDL